MFATTLNYINEDVTPDLTDDWVSSNLAESMGMNNVAELKTFVSNSLLFNQEANELYGQLYDAAEVNTDTLPKMCSSISPIPCCTSRICTPRCAAFRWRPC